MLKQVQHDIFHFSPFATQSQRGEGGGEGLDLNFQKIFCQDYFAFINLFALFLDVKLVANWVKMRE